MNYNKKNQAFTILGRFRLFEAGKGEVEYCRIHFHTTGHVAVIPAGIVKTNDFEDESLAVKEEPKTESDPIVDTDDFDPSKDIELDGEELIQSINESDEKQELYGDADIDVEVKEDVVEVKPAEKPSMVQFIAINPDGESTDVCVSVEDFCELHNLEVEAVQACLEGKQKTHKKWRFTTV